MPSFRIARPALADLEGIGRYTRRRWGLEQARRYLGELDGCFHLLADHPERGKDAEFIRPGLWSFRQGHHIIYYRRTGYGVRVIRILHERMLPELHLQENDNEDIE